MFSYVFSMFLHVPKYFPKECPQLHISIRPKVQQCDPQASVNWKKEIILNIRIKPLFLANLIGPAKRFRLSFTLTRPKRWDFQKRFQKWGVSKTHHFENGNVDRWKQRLSKTMTNKASQCLESISVIGCFSVVLVCEDGIKKSENAMWWWKKQPRTLVQALLCFGWIRILLKDLKKRIWLVWLGLN